jgi:hypothetical protein
MTLGMTRKTGERPIGFRRSDVESVGLAVPTRFGAYSPQAAAGWVSKRAIRRRLYALATR